MTNKLTTILAIAIAVMGVVHIIALVIDGIAAIGFMTHNPFAWAVAVLISCLAATTLPCSKSTNDKPER